VKEVKSDQASQNGKKVEEAYQKEKHTAGGLESHKRRKIMPDSKVHAVNNLEEDDNDNNDDSESENE
jgi:hypothetical protein